MATVSPFNTPANPQSQISADGIYYGWMGLIAQPTFIASMANIVGTGVKAALTDAAVQTAIKNTLIAADVAPSVIAAVASSITTGMKTFQLDPAVESAQYDVLVDALNDCLIHAESSAAPLNMQQKRAWMLLCLACAYKAGPLGSFTGDESAAALADLLNRVVSDTDELIP